MLNRIGNSFAVRVTLVVVTVLIAFTTPAVAERSVSRGVAMPSRVQGIVNVYCVGCHGDEKQKGKVRLDNLMTLSVDARHDLLNKVQEALHFEEMPPEKKKQPTSAERKLLVDWVGGELSQANVSKLADKLRRPEYGNFVDHDKLFSGEYANEKAFTPDRRWQIGRASCRERV